MMAFLRKDSTLGTVTLQSNDLYLPINCPHSPVPSSWAVSFLHIFIPQSLAQNPPTQTNCVKLITFNWSVPSKYQVCNCTSDTVGIQQMSSEGICVRRVLTAQTCPLPSWHFWSTESQGKVAMISPLAEEETEIVCREVLSTGRTITRAQSVDTIFTTIVQSQTAAPWQSQHLNSGLPGSSQAALPRSLCPGKAVTRGF